MKKLNVIVLMGGTSSERSVSLASGQQVVEHLDPEKFNIKPVLVSPDGKFWQTLSKKSLIEKIVITSPSSKKEKLTLKQKNINIANFSKESIDIVFIALHGPGGEDGSIQGFLDLVKVKYTGSGVLASAIGMDKIVFRKLMKASGVRVPKYFIVNKIADLANIKSVLSSPSYFVKPFNLGSSVGMSIVTKDSDLIKAVKNAFNYTDKVLVDEYIDGREFTCAILGNYQPEALPVIEILPKKSKFFDYESKYSDQGAEEIVPAKISKALSKRIQELAIKVYMEVGCHGFGRVDILMRKNNLYVLEINTIPGLTNVSLLPKAAKAAGLTYSKLLEKIIYLGLE